MKIDKGGFGQSIWPKPDLERDGQLAFWNQQADSYETADMTNDNLGEIVEVVERFRANPQIWRDIVVLGGAVGCRDPKMILQEAICQNPGSSCSPPSEGVKIFFSDLAPDQVDRAKYDILAKCQNCENIKVDFLAGSIHEVYKDIEPACRALMLGVYDAHGFFQADSLRGYPLAGFDEYLNNSAVLGDHFWFDWLFHKDGQLITKSSGLEISVSDPDEAKRVVRKHLRESYDALITYYGDCAAPMDDLVAIQVVSAKENRDGFFLSHWFAIDNLIKVIDSVFPWPDYLSNFTRFPKGALFEIRPANQPANGVVTVLNNVIGNVLPEEQLATLKAIKAVIG